MRSYVAADLHLRLTGPRADECRRCFDWLRDNIMAAAPDVFVVAGDFYDKRATPAEERFAQEFLQSVSEGIGGAPILLIGGNHDDYEQLEVLAATKAKGPIVAFTRPGLQVVRGVTIGCLPWPRVAHLAAAMPSASIQERREAARAALVDILRGFREHAEHTEIPFLLVAHANVLGASMDSGQPVAGGDEIALSVSDLMEAEVGAIVLGHIHVGQRMAAPVPCSYTGSLFRQTFGEWSWPKGTILAEWNGSGWKFTRRKSPARRMLLVACRWTGGDDAYLDGDEVDPEECQDAEIRVRVEFASDEREAARAAVAEVRRTLEDAGAYSITVEERPVTIQRTRCSEIAMARTTCGKIKAWAKAVSLDVPQSIAEKLAALEEGS